MFLNVIDLFGQIVNIKMLELVWESCIRSNRVTLMYWIYRVQRYKYINSALSDAIYFFLVLHPLRHAATLIFSGEPAALYRRRKKTCTEEKRLRGSIILSSSRTVILKIRSESLAWRTGDFWPTGRGTLFRIKNR